MNKLIIATLAGLFVLTPLAAQAGQLQNRINNQQQRTYIGVKNGSISSQEFRQSSKFSTWLYRIAWNVASDRRQTLAQERSRFQTIAESISTQHDDPDLMQLHYQDLVRSGLSLLSEDHRSVLVLHDLEELPQKEVAEILKIPVGTVKSRLFHARSGMRKFLEQAGLQL